MKFLIVDDDEKIREMICAYLGVSHNLCDSAHDGSEGFQKVIESSYDLVLMDINMPKMNGIECIKAIRVVDPDIPIIIMTGMASDVEIENGIKNGANAVLKKPFKFEELDIAIQQFYHEY